MFVFFLFCYVFWFFSPLDWLVYRLISCKFAIFSVWQFIIFGALLSYYVCLKCNKNSEKPRYIPRLAKKTSFRKRAVAKPKDPVTKEQRTDAIYSIPCNNCDNEYIGQTKRQFGTRLKEHQKAVFLRKKENSALSEHTCLTNHTIGWENSKNYHR